MLPLFIASLFIFYVFPAFFIWKISEKAGKPKWPAIIPVFNIYYPFILSKKFYLLTIILFLIFFINLSGFILTLFMIFFIHFTFNKLAPFHSKGFIVVLLMKILFFWEFEAYKIPTGSMIPNLIRFDHIMVNQFAYQIKLPFSSQTLLTLSQPKRGEVITFRYPLYESPGLEYELLDWFTNRKFSFTQNIANPKNFIKRVIATPGDFISIKNKEIIINDKVLMKKRVHNKTELLNQILNIYNPNKSFYSEDYPHNQPYYIYSKDKKVYGYKGEEVFLETVGNKSYPVQYYSNEKDYYEDIDLYIPKSGDLLAFSIDVNNYEYLILEVNKKRKILIDRFHSMRFYNNLINKKELFKTLKYQVKVKENYYFLLGDNRDNSSDSRSWGFVAEKFILGKAMFIYFPFERFSIKLNP